MGANGAKKVGDKAPEHIALPLRLVEASRICATLPFVLCPIEGAIMSNNLASVVSAPIPEQQDPHPVPRDQKLPGVSSSEGNGAVAPREITFIEAVWELGEWAGNHYDATGGPDFGAPSLAQSEYVDNEWHLRDEDGKLIAIAGRDGDGNVGVI
jgi:hypothetical protein